MLQILLDGSCNMVEHILCCSNGNGLQLIYRFIINKVHTGIANGSLAGEFFSDLVDLFAPFSEKMQDLTDKFVKDIDKMAEAKQKEIMEI